MARLSRLALVLLACFTLATSLVVAAGPALFMVYGGGLERPVFIVQKDLETFAFLSCAKGYDVGPTSTPEGPFLNVAIFWNANVWADPNLADRLIPTLRPEMAGQHGRIYLPRDGRPATVFVTRVSHIVSTPREAGALHEWGLPSPVPVRSDSFEGGCRVSVSSTPVARAAGIAGF